MRSLRGRRRSSSPHATMSESPESPSRPGRRVGRLGRLVRAAPWVQALLRVPLFWKILVANSGIVAAAVLFTAARFGHAPASRLSAGALLVLAGGAMTVSAALNALLLWLALSPERELEETARRVKGGDLAARAPTSPLADANLSRLIEVFNGMLDRLEERRDLHRRLAMRALASEEEIRGEVAKRLHEDTAQTLAALLLETRLWGRAGRVPAEAERSARLEEAAAGALERIRAVARELHPPELDDLGLVNAARAYTRSAAEGEGIRLEFRADPVDDLLCEASRLALYRILQEAVSNVLRHSGAERLRVSLRRRRDRVVAEVSDDGVGFDPDQVDGGGLEGLGLFAIRERAVSVGGTVRVESRPGHGTRIRVEIPASDATSRSGGTFSAASGRTDERTV